MWTIFHAFIECIIILLLFFMFWLFFFFFFGCQACGILVYQSGIEHILPGIGSRSLNHRTTRELPRLSFKTDPWEHNSSPTCSTHVLILLCPRAGGGGGREHVQCNPSQPQLWRHGNLDLLPASCSSVTWCKPPHLPGPPFWSEDTVTEDWQGDWIRKCLCSGQ